MEYLLVVFTQPPAGIPSTALDAAEDVADSGTLQCIVVGRLVPADHGPCTEGGT